MWCIYIATQAIPPISLGVWVFLCYNIFINLAVVGVDSCLNDEYDYDFDSGIENCKHGAQPYKLYFIVANVKYSSGCGVLPTGDSVPQ